MTTTAVVRVSVCVLVLVSGACSRAETSSPEQAGAPGASSGQATAGEGPCALLTLAEVRRVFPDAPAGQIQRSQEKHGVVSCEWGRRLTLVDGTDNIDTPEDEARSWTLMLLDPLDERASRHVRFETIRGVGDQAVAVVEREDKAKGFILSVAYIVVRRGPRQVTLMSTDLARRERSEALDALQQLGRAVAGRLK